MELFKSKKKEKVADIAGEAMVKPVEEIFTAVNFYPGGAIVWIFKRVGDDVQLVAKKSFS